MSSEELKAALDTAFDGVNESKVGPITLSNGQLSVLGFQTYLAVVAQVVPKLCRYEAVEPPEEWRG